MLYDKANKRRRRFLRAAVNGSNPAPHASLTGCRIGGRQRGAGQNAVNSLIPNWRGAPAKFRGGVEN